MAVEMQYINARSAEEKCNAGMVRAAGKGTSLQVRLQLFVLMSCIGKISG
jgi:hypothetical protein